MFDKIFKIGYFPIGRAHFNQSLAENLASNMHANLNASNFEVIGEPHVLWTNLDIQNTLSKINTNELDLILIFQTTFTDSTLTLDLAQHINAPIVLWSVPEKWIGERLQLNSFTGMNLAAHALKKSKLKYFYIYSDVENQDSFSQLKSIASASMAKKKLNDYKIGLIGTHPDGFETCDFNGDQIRKIFGLNLKKFSLAEIFNQIDQVEIDRILTHRAVLEQTIDNLNSVDQSALNKSIATYDTFINLGEKFSLDGLAVRCWPEFFTDLGCAACGALSLATEAGLACSCEADVLGLVTQLLLQTLSGTPAIGVDMVGFDFKDNSSALWHCGLAPSSMANPSYPVEAANHSNRGVPLLLQFPFKPGQVTLARFSQSDEQLSLVLSRGEMLNRPRPFTGTCGVIRFESLAENVVKTIMNKGLEHHIALTYGDHLSELEVFAELLDLPVIRL